MGEAEVCGIRCLVVFVVWVEKGRGGMEEAPCPEFQFRFVSFVSFLAV
jgi:hypothetical protein